MAGRNDNTASTDGSYGWDDVKRAQDSAKAHDDLIYDIMARVASGELGMEYLGRAVYTYRPQWGARIPAHMHNELNYEQIRTLVKERVTRWPELEAETDNDG